MTNRMFSAFPKLAMRNFEVYGLPLKIHTAESKAEALETLEQPTRSPCASVQPDGCFYRCGDGNRTAPAWSYARPFGKRWVINSFNSSFAPANRGSPRSERSSTATTSTDYFTKAEATEDKLYSLVKSGVRQYYWSMLTRIAIPFLNMIIAAKGSQEKLTQNFQFVMEQANTASGSTLPLCYIVDDTVIYRHGWDEQTAKALIEKLDQEAGKPLSAVGDKFVADANDHLLIKVASQPDRAEVNALIKTAFMPPMEVVEVVHSVFVGLGTAWQKA